MSTPTKDSNYSRKYTKAGVYPEAARATSAHAISGNIATQYPWYGEFSDGPEPSDPVKRAYQLYMQQSEFKKPYMPGGYTEMETNADPPPGISVPGSDGPGGIPSVDTPLPPPGIPDGGGTVTSFYVLVDKDYERGGYCRGNTVNIRLWCQQPAYGFHITGEKAGTSVNYISGFGTNTLYLEITADPAEWAWITIYVEMRSYEGITGTSGVNVNPKVCDEYFVLELAGGGITAVTVFSAENGDVATDIPDNTGTGLITFPCLIEEVAFWYSGSTVITDNALVDADFNPDWEGGITTVYMPDLHNVESPVCSSANNAYVGGTWPKVEEDTSELSDINAVGCNPVYGRTITNKIEWAALLSVVCPAGSVLTKPFRVESYHELNTSHDSTPICGLISSETLVSGERQLHTEMTGYSSNFYYEEADYTLVEIAPGPPPILEITDIGRGSSYTEVAYEWRQYSALDNTTPILTFEHYIYAFEQWNRTFYLAGNVINFSRTTDSRVSIPLADYSGLTTPSLQEHRVHSVFGGHLAVYYEMSEVLQLDATDLTYQGGVVGPAYLNGWYNNPIFGVVDLPVKRGVHAGFIYGDDVADLVDICTLTRDSNLETCIEDLYAFFRTEAGVLPKDLLWKSVVGLAYIRF